ncbi:MAG TPA: hypothetical protein VMH38_08810 [Thermoplasmata archaeon]|nr:hypothetical protein [Thermoplasmata archaeon]
MQVISVERWTFWAALVTTVAGPIITSIETSSYTNGSTTWSISWISVVFVLLLVSVALGGSRDPSVRRIPYQRDS